MGTALLVTGGSRGIGAATARLAAARGYDVCVNYLGAEAAAQAVVADVKAAGRRAIAVQGDIALEPEVIRLFEATEAELGPVGALVNNAGILERQAPLAEIGVEHIERVLRTNVIGVLLCAREAVRRMSSARGGEGGAIVNVSSVAARLGAPNGEKGDAHEFITFSPR